MDECRPAEHMHIATIEFEQNRSTYRMHRAHSAIYFIQHIHWHLNYRVWFCGLPYMSNPQSASRRWRKTSQAVSLHLNTETCTAIIKRIHLCVIVESGRQNKMTINCSTPPVINGMTNSFDWTHTHNGSRWRPRRSKKYNKYSNENRYSSSFMWYGKEDTIQERKKKWRETLMATTQ